MIKDLTGEQMAVLNKRTAAFMEEMTKRRRTLDEDFTLEAQTGRNYIKLVNVGRNNNGSGVGRL
jgi:hypothetical protein